MSVARRKSGKYSSANEFPKSPIKMDLINYLASNGFKEIEWNLDYQRDFIAGISKNEKYYEVVDELNAHFVKFWMSENGIYTLEFFVATSDKYKNTKAYIKVCDTGEETIYNDYDAFRNKVISILK